MLMSFEEERVAYPAEDKFDAPGSSLAPSIVIDVTADDRQWGMFCHLSALLGYFVGGLTFLGPLIVWLVKKDTSKFVDYHGKESLNFQINILIYSLICIPLMFVLIGFLLLPVVVVYSIVMPIIAGIKANEGQLYEYPYTFRLIK
jgi:uncharacterized Tic20 family protein